MSVYGAVEIGGTKTDVAVGTSPDDLGSRARFPTSSPQHTLESVTEFLTAHSLSAIGVAAFGPLQLDSRQPRFGTVMATPKQGWSGADLLSPISDATGLPVGIDTDVNGAALGEGRWGASRGMTNHAYMTVGTGIGVGVVVGGQVLRGQRHPEVGHIAVSRLDGDRHPGSCPYHGACLEGMASGPALEARFGPPHTWAGNDSIVGLAGHYVSQGLRSLVYTVAPERIVVGGGVSSLPGFHERLRMILGTDLAGYPISEDLGLLVCPPGLGDRSGLTGGLILAEMAAT